MTTELHLGFLTFEIVYRCKICKQEYIAFDDVINHKCSQSNPSDTTKTTKDECLKKRLVESETDESIASRSDDSTSSSLSPEEHYSSSGVELFNKRDTLIHYFNPYHKWLSECNTRESFQDSGKTSEDWSLVSCPDCKKFERKR